MAVTWVCSNCGNTHGNEPHAVTQVDARYTTGFCFVCSPHRKPIADKKNPGKWVEPARRVVQLIRADVWDPSTLTRCAVRDRRRHLVKQYESNADRLTPEELAEARHLVGLDR